MKWVANLVFKICSVKSILSGLQVDISIWGASRATKGHTCKFNARQRKAIREVKGMQCIAMAVHCKALPWNADAMAMHRNAIQ